MTDFSIIGRAANLSNYDLLYKHFDLVVNIYRNAFSRMYGWEFYYDGRIKLEDGAVVKLDYSFTDCLEILKIEKRSIGTISPNKKGKKYNKENQESQEKKYSYLLCIKKIRFLTTLHNEIEKHFGIDTLTLKITWIVIVLNSMSGWDEFSDRLLLNQVESPKNTRPSKGFKPYKINSKIIYNRNGSR